MENSSVRKNGTTAAVPDMESKMTSTWQPSEMWSGVIIWCWAPVRMSNVNTPTREEHLIQSLHCNAIKWVIWALRQFAELLGMRWKKVRTAFVFQNFLQRVAYAMYVGKRTCNSGVASDLTLLVRMFLGLSYDSWNYPVNKSHTLKKKLIANVVDIAVTTPCY